MSKMFIRKLFVAAFLIFVTWYGKAQVPSVPATVPTPNAWNFTQYGKVPISYFTGLPTVSIPLADFTYKDLQIPIALSYNLSSVKPETKPGVTGLGWNLSLGGVISRQVRGLPDEFNFSMTVRDYTTGINYTRNFPNGFYKSMAASMPSLSLLEANKLPFYTNSSQTLFGPPYTLLAGPLPYLYDGAAYPTPCGNYSPLCPAALYFNGAWSNSWPYAYLDGEQGFTGWNSKGIKDYMRDEFTFSVNGLSGTFYLSKEYGQIDIVCDANVEITKYEESNILSELTPPPFSQGGTIDGYIFGLSPWQREQKYPKVIGGFAIRDKDTRYTYVFGRTKACAQNPDCAQYSEAIEYEINLYGLARDFWTASSWHLTTIYTPDGKAIYLDYERSGLDTRVFKTLSFNSLSDYSERLQNKGGKLIYPSYLKRIYSDLLEISLDYSDATQMRYEDASPNIYTLSEGGSTNEGLSHMVTSSRPIKSRKLDLITLQTYNNPKKEIFFQYNNVSSKRLMLQRAGVRSAGTNEVSYQFEYDESLSLPNYLSDQTDHWGYWNGNTTSLANAPSEATILGKRQPVAAYLYASTLKKIIYPTGGYTELVYEPNEYSKVVNTLKDQAPLSGVNTMAGGLRIKKMRNSDGQSVSSEKEYFYKDGYTPGLTSTQLAALPSSGVLNASPQYRWSSSNMRYHTVSTYSQSGYFEMVADQPLLPLYDNYYLGYSTVVEKEKDNSYTIYQFSNHDNGYVDEAYDELINDVLGSSFTKYADKRNTRGKLIQQSVYNNEGKLLTETTTTYQYDYSTGPANQLNYFQDIDYATFYTPSLGLSLIVGSKYKVYKTAFVPAVQQTKTFDQLTSNYLATRQEFVYGNAAHRKMTQQVNYLNNGTIERTVFKYPADFNTPDFMLDNLKQSYPATLMEKLRYLKTGDEVTKLVGGELYEYSLVDGHSQAFPWLNTVYRLRVSAPADSTSYIQTVPVTRGFNSTTLWTKDARYSEEVKLTKYDMNYNAIEGIKRNGERSISVLGNHGLNTLALVSTNVNESAYLWGYTSFEPFSYKNEDGFTFNEFDNEKDFVFSGNVSTSYFSGKHSFIGTVTSKEYVHAATIYVAAKAGGNAPSFEMLMGGTTPISGPAFQKIGKKGGWDIYKLRYANGGSKVRIHSNGNEIDELRISSEKDQALITSYAYTSGLLYSITDPNLNTTYYDYDGFGRLQHIRDKDQNILKKFCYNYQGQAEECQVDTSPQWVATAETRCKPCALNEAYTTSTLQRKEEDQNPASATYGQTRWVDDNIISTSCVFQNVWVDASPLEYRCRRDFWGNLTGEQEKRQLNLNPCSGIQEQWVVVGTNCATCPKPQSWQPTGAYRCVVDGSGANTGYQEREEQNREPCSLDPNATRWVTDGYNPSACPLPSSCTVASCESQGPQYKCIDGVCEIGFKVITSSYYSSSNNTCQILYHYEWSDGSWSEDYYSSSRGRCLVIGF